MDAKSFEVPDRLITYAHAQQLTALSRRKLHDLAVRGVLTRIRIGRSVRFRQSDVQRLIERGAA